MIYCIDVVFLKLFLFVYYSIVYEKLVIQKIGNPNRVIVNEYYILGQVASMFYVPKKWGMHGSRCWRANWREEK